MQSPPSVMASGGVAGVTVKFPFGTETSLCQMTGEQRHPIPGRGLLRVQKFPGVKMSGLDGIRKALELNLLELGEEPKGYGFGSYCFRDGLLCFSGFMPNMMYRPGFLPNIYYAMAGRAHFAAEALGDEA